MQNAQVKPAPPASDTLSAPPDSNGIRPGRRWLIFLAIAVLALAARLPQLARRPMHTDEAVNAYIIGELLQGHAFHYDPQDRHGPVLYAFTLPVVRAAGARRFTQLTETMLRLAPVIAGTLAVLLFLPLAADIGTGPAAVAALLWALAPLPLYYSRYFIHETFFVAATLGLVLFAGRAIRSGSALSAALAGVFAALMLASKETAFINFAALAAAGLWEFLSGRARRAPGETPQASSPPSRAKFVKILAIASSAFAILVVALYSWGGRHWSGPVDLVRSIPHFVSRASGEGHQKPAGYYFALLGGGWSGIPVLLLALSGAWSVVRNRVGRRAGQFWLAYAIAISICYSVIPYKTPWLALNLWLPLSVLAGMGLIHWLRPDQAGVVRTIGWVGAALILGLLARDTVQRVFLKPADEDNPYAYAHTVDDLLGLPPRLEQLARADHLSNPTIAVVAADPWPLPWYLRGMQAGFWQPGQTPGAADFYITTPEAAASLGPLLKNRRPEFFGIRPEAVVILWDPPTSSP